MRVRCGRGRERRRELRARHAGDGEHRLLVRGQPLDLVVDHLPQRLRRAEGDVVRRPFELPDTVDLVHLCTRDQVVHRVDQEQRVAVGMSMEDDRQLVRKAIVGKPPREVLAHRNDVQEVQGDLVAMPVELQLLLRRAQGAAAGHHVGRAVRRDDEQA